MGELEALGKADFNWVVHREVVWDDNVPDVPGLHGDVSDAIIAAARTMDGPRPALGRMLLGPAGIGKTHLLAMLRQRATAESMNFVMADLTDVRDFFETLLLSFVLSFQQPIAGGHTQLNAILRSVIARLSTTVDAEDYVRLLGKQPVDAFKTPIKDILKNLQRKDPTGTARHSDVVRAAVLLHARDYEVNSIGSTWLQGLEIDDEARRQFGFAAPRQKPSDIVLGLSWLASFRGPTIIAIDQLDPIVAYNRQAARAERAREDDESAELAKKILNDLCNGLGSLYATTVRALPVVTCLEGSLETLKEYGLQSNMDRFEPEESLAPLTDRETAEALVRGRLDPAFAAAGFAPPYPTWPFAPGFFEGAVGRAPRELLKRCDAHRQQCLQHGAVTELDSYSEETAAAAPAVTAPAANSLDARFGELRSQAKTRKLMDERWEDDQLAGLMMTAAICLVKESPADEAFDVVVDSDFPGRHSFMPLHARIRKIELATGAERHYCIRALEKMHPNAYIARLRAAMTSAGIDRKLDFRHLVIFRANPAPHGEKTDQITRDFLARGGVMVAPKPAEIATLWALQQLAAEGPDGFDAWLAARQPVRQLPMMQQARLVKSAAPEASETPQPAPPTEQPPKQRALPPAEAPAPPADPDKPANATAPIATPQPEPQLDTPPPAPQQAATAPAPAAASADADLPVGRRVIGGEARGDAVTLPLRELRKHIAIFAGAGSGKTVLVKRIVEEAALLGVPAIVIDTANDLAQFGDPWPTPPDAWGSEDAEKAQRFFGATETVLWTPGLERGNPLRLEPLPDLAAMANDPDELEDAIAMAREALQGIVAPTSSETARNRLGILTAALRFFAEHGGGGTLEDFVALLDDLPDGADGGIGDARKHAGKMADALRSAMQLDPLLISSGESLDPVALLGLNGGGARTRISVINFTGLPALDQQQQFLNRLFMALFSWIKKHPATGEAPLRGLLVLDEARDFIPAVSRSACRDSFMRLAAQARKYGLGLVIATQAPKEIHNGVVSNCSTSFYGKGSSPAVINAIRELLQSKGGHGNDVARLAQGRFYLHNADVTRTPVKIGASLCLSWHREPLDPEAIAERARVSRA